MLRADQETTLREILATARPDGAVAFGVDTLRGLLASLDAARAAGAGQMRERAAYTAAHACLVPPDGGSPTAEESAVCEEAKRRILALPDVDTSMGGIRGDNSRWPARTWLRDAAASGVQAIHLHAITAGWQASAQMAGSSGWTVAVCPDIEDAVAGALAGHGRCGEVSRRHEGLFERWVTARQRDTVAWGGP